MFSEVSVIRGGLHPGGGGLHPGGWRSAFRGLGVYIRGRGICIQGRGSASRGREVYIQEGWADPPGLPQEGVGRPPPPPTPGSDI